MNDDLIKRSDAIDAICKTCGVASEHFQKCEGYAEESTWCDELVALRTVPSAQPERKTGKWMPLQLSMAHPPYQCSCCFRNAPMVETGCLVNRHLEALLTDWCPWCGAKMGEGEHDG